MLAVGLGKYGGLERGILEEGEMEGRPTNCSSATELYASESEEGDGERGDAWDDIADDQGVIRVLRCFSSHCEEC